MTSKFERAFHTITVIPISLAFRSPASSSNARSARADGVVTPVRELMRIVPAAARLIVEADILNRDIGFIADGQLAEIKVETYPFTRHGILHGTVSSIFRDSVSLNPGNGGQPRPAPRKPDRPATRPGCRSTAAR